MAEDAKHTFELYVIGQCSGNSLFKRLWKKEINKKSIMYLTARPSVIIVIIALNQDLNSKKKFKENSFNPIFLVV